MEIRAAVRALAALAHETRLDLFRLLVQAGPEGLAAGAVSEALEIPAATLSFHLKELKSAGLIRCERDGRSRIYSPDFVMASALVGFLSENCCQGAVGTGGCRPSSRTRRGRKRGAPSPRRTPA
jgi:DNA-binding transcriptional ArsR family regulator